MAIENMLDEDAPGDAEEGEDGEGGEGEDTGFDAKKIILFVVVPLLLLIGSGAGLHFSGVLAKFTGGGAEETAEGATDDGHGKVSKKHEVTTTFFLEIPNLIVNLSNDGGGQPRYLRLSVQLELGSQEDLHAVEAVMPRVVDQFQTYLRELRVKDLRGSGGMYRLQIELLSRVNAAAYPVEIKDVLFQEILIQ